MSCFRLITPIVREWTCENCLAGTATLQKFFKLDQTIAESISFLKGTGLPRNHETVNTTQENLEIWRFQGWIESFALNKDFPYFNISNISNSSIFQYFQYSSISITFQYFQYFHYFPIAYFMIWKRKKQVYGCMEYGPVQIRNPIV